MVVNKVITDTTMPFEAERFCMLFLDGPWINALVDQRRRQQLTTDDSHDTSAPPVRSDPTVVEVQRTTSKPALLQSTSVVPVVGYSCHVASSHHFFVAQEEAGNYIFRHTRHRLVHNFTLITNRVGATPLRASFQRFRSKCITMAVRWRTPL